VHEGVEVAYSVARPGAGVLAAPEPGWRAAPVDVLGDPASKLSGSSEHTPPARSAVPAVASAVSSAPAAPPVAALSYTALQDYERCGYRFYLQRVLRIPPLEETGTAVGAARKAAGTGGMSGALRGTIVHDLLEQLDLRRTEPPTAQEIRRATSRAGADATERELAEIETLLARFLASPLRQRLLTATDLRREQPFAFVLETPDGAAIPLTGVFDAVARESRGRTLVVDYKSDRLGDADLETTVRGSYGLQRAAYALAALRDGATEVEVVHVFLERPDDPVQATFRQQDAPALAAELGARADRILSREFPVAADPGPRICDGCPGRGSLCSWPLERTRAPEGRLL
jgi:RecB family exonuclease